MPRPTRLTAVAIVAGLCGCVIQPLLLADLDEDKVIVQASSYADNSAILAAANDGCAIHGRKAVGPLSFQALDDYGNLHVLFACAGG